MNNTIDKLCNGLVGKKFLPIECEGMVEDIMDFINDEKHLSITTLNQELEDLGWGIHVLDDALYALSITLIGNDRQNKAHQVIKLNTDKGMQCLFPLLLEKAAI